MIEVLFYATVVGLLMLGFALGVGVKVEVRRRERARIAVLLNDPDELERQRLYRKAHPEVVD